MDYTATWETDTVANFLVCSLSCTGRPWDRAIHRPLVLLTVEITNPEPRNWKNWTTLTVDSERTRGRYNDCTKKLTMSDFFGVNIIPFNFFGLAAASGGWRVWGKKSISRKEIVLEMSIKALDAVAGPSKFYSIQSPSQLHIPVKQYPEETLDSLLLLLVCCLFSWRYNPLWLYFPQSGSGL
jgi:hypothetical protein